MPGKRRNLQTDLWFTLKFSVWVDLLQAQRAIIYCQRSCFDTWGNLCLLLRHTTVQERILFPSYHSVFKGKKEHCCTSSGENSSLLWGVNLNRSIKESGHPWARFGIHHCETGGVGLQSTLLTQGVTAKEYGTLGGTGEERFGVEQGVLQVVQ